MRAMYLPRVSLLVACVGLVACGGGGSSGSKGPETAPTTPVTTGSGGEPGASDGTSNDIDPDERTDTYAITAVGIYLDAVFLIGDAGFTLSDTAGSFGNLFTPTTVYSCLNGKGEKVKNVSKVAATGSDERQVYPGDFIQEQYNGCSQDGHVKDGEQRLDFTDYPPVPAEGEPFAFAAVYRSYILNSGGSGEVNGQIDRLVYHTESRLTANDVRYVLTGVNSHLFDQSIAPSFFPEGIAFATPQQQINEAARWIDPQDTVPVFAAETGYTKIDGLDRTVSQFDIDMRKTRPDSRASGANTYQIKTTSPLVIDEVAPTPENNQANQVARSGGFIITLDTGTVITLEAFDPNGGVVPGATPLKNVRLRLDRGADNVFEDERWIAWSEFGLL